jgi:hypothetical protein
MSHKHRDLPKAVPTRGYVNQDVRDGVFIAAYQDAPSGLRTLGTWSSGEFVGRLSRVYGNLHRSENELLGRVIRNQLAQSEYSGKYIAFLLNQLSEEEFEAVSVEHAKDFLEASTEELDWQISVIDGVVGHSLDSDAYAELLLVKRECVDLALAQSGQALKLLPHDDRGE